MNNFLKYELFFIDFDISDIRLGSPKAVGNGVLGATQNNYHFKIVLNQLIGQTNINFITDLPHVTGGFVLRKSFTDY